MSSQLATFGRLAVFIFWRVVLTRMTRSLIITRGRESSIKVVIYYYNMAQWWWWLVIFVVGDFSHAVLLESQVLFYFFPAFGFVCVISHLRVRKRRVVK
jgi:hypothetical protein